jgi:4-amino-4-deoxy-L-arabinose transferase-like glycosyltransferase
MRARAAASVLITRNAAWLVLLVFGALALRILWLDADASPTLSWSGAPFTDEGLYAHAARNRVLFGTPRTNQWDNRLVSPLWDMIVDVVFRVVGVGYVPLRMINVVLTTLVLPLWWAFLRRDLRPRAALLGVALLSFNYFWFQYSRLGLLEPGMVAWMIAGAWCWRRALSGTVHWAVACGVCVAVAWVWKSLALVFIPVPLLALALLRARGWQRVAIGYGVGLALVFAIYAVVWYLPNAAEWTRYNAFYARDRVPPSFAAAWQALLSNLSSRYVLGQAPLLIGLATLGAVGGVMRTWRRTVSPVVAFALAWLWCGAVLLVLPYSPPRYYTLLVPPIVALCVVLFQYVDNRKYRLMPILVLAVLGAHVVWDGALYGQWATHRTTSLPDSSRALQNIVPQGTTLLGVTACGLSLENDLPCAPLIAGLANDGDPFTALGTRYAVVENNNREDWMRRFVPDALAAATPLQTLPLGPRRVTVFRLEDGTTPAAGTQPNIRTGKE